MQPLRPYEKEDTLKQFLQFDRNVLRFFCVWDDSDRLVSLRFSVHWGCAYGIDSDIVMLETFSKYPIVFLTLF